MKDFFLLAGSLPLTGGRGWYATGGRCNCRTTLEDLGPSSRVRAALAGSIGRYLAGLISRSWCLYWAPRPASPLAAGQTSDGRGLAEEPGPACRETRSASAIFLGQRALFLEPTRVSYSGTFSHCQTTRLVGLLAFAIGGRAKNSEARASPCLSPPSPAVGLLCMLGERIPPSAVPMAPRLPRHGDARCLGDARGTDVPGRRDRARCGGSTTAPWSAYGSENHSTRDIATRGCVKGCWTDRLHCLKGLPCWGSSKD